MQSPSSNCGLCDYMVGMTPGRHTDCEGVHYFKRKIKEK